MVRLKSLISPKSVTHLNESAMGERIRFVNVKRKIQGVHIVFNIFVGKLMTATELHRCVELTDQSIERRYASSLRYSSL